MTEKFKKIRITPTIATILIILVIFILLILSACIKIVPLGHKGVVTLLGDLQEETLEPGFHMLSPFKSVYDYDCRNKHVDIKDLAVPSQDQLTTEFDLTVKFRMKMGMIKESYSNTGNIEAVVNTHLIPQIRSTFRSMGNNVALAEDFYTNKVKIKMAKDCLDILQKKLSDKGLFIEDVLIRKVDLPINVKKGVEEKVIQAQKAEREKEELNRYRTEQDKKIALAESEAEAAKQEKIKRTIQAEATALEIKIKAEATANARLILAKAKAKAIELEGLALKKNSTIKDIRLIEKWNGILPSTVVGNSEDKLLLNLGVKQN